MISHQLGEEGGYKQNFRRRRRYTDAMAEQEATLGADTSITGADTSQVPNNRIPRSVSRLPYMLMFDILVPGRLCL